MNKKHDPRERPSVTSVKDNKQIHASYVGTEGQSVAGGKLIRPSVAGGKLIRPKCCWR